MLKLSLVTVIRALEDKLCLLRYCEDPTKTLTDRDNEINILQEHLRNAHTALVKAIEDEEGLGKTG